MGIGGQIWSTMEKYRIPPSRLVGSRDRLSLQYVFVRSRVGKAYEIKDFNLSYYALECKKGISSHDTTTLRISMFEQPNRQPSLQFHGVFLPPILLPRPFVPLNISLSNRLH